MPRIGLALGILAFGQATGMDILVDHCQMVVAIRKDLGLQP
jgi:hypothetical protein